MTITGAPTKRSAIITALEDYNRRHRMAGLVGLLGTCKDMITPAQLRDLRKAGGERT